MRTSWPLALFLFQLLLILATRHQVFAVESQPDLDGFLRKLEREAATIDSFSCSFTQVRHLAIFPSPVKFSGSLVLVKPDRLRWEFREPIPSVQLDVDEINLQPNTVVPLGLIITELVANALKHAFPDGRKGDVTVSLRAKEENRLALAVRDNGMGTLNEEQFEKSNSLGLRLVRIFADQLKGEIEIVRSAGTEFRLTFQVDTGV